MRLTPSVAGQQWRAQQGTAHSGCAQEVQEEVVQLVARANATVEVSVSAGISKASAAEVERKRKLAVQSALAQKRAKLFGLEDEGSRSDGSDSSDDDTEH